MGTEGHVRRGLPGWFSIREEPQARLSRIGVIDVGSNSVRLVVFDGMARSPAYFYNEKVLCGLGAGLAETGRLSPEGWQRALAALHRFVALAGRMELSGMIAVATAAVREADGRAGVLRSGRGRDRAAAACRHRVGGGAAGGARACCSAGRTPRGWSATWAAPRWSSRGSPTARSHACGTSPLGPLQLADIRDAEQARRS